MTSLSKKAGTKLEDLGFFQNLKDLTRSDLMAEKEKVWCL
jgi:hypothetical protein